MARHRRIEDLNCRQIKPGEKNWGLYGASGQVKSTFGFPSVTALSCGTGHILIDGQDVSHSDQPKLAAQNREWSQETAISNRPAFAQHSATVSRCDPSEVIAAAAKAKRMRS